MNRKIHVRFWSRAAGATPSLRSTVRERGASKKKKRQETCELQKRRRLYKKGRACTGDRLMQ